MVVLALPLRFWAGRTKQPQ
uniref:Uncharacterized protein n=1 Tax=Arundo donax TaxID=35708 RepID=A0A0A8Z0X7_ARUDO